MARLALVTGGAGFIGSNLVRALRDHGERVRAFDDLSTGRPVNLDDMRDDIELVHGDVRDAEAVAAAMQGAEVVFHQAAIPSVARSVADPVASHDVNVTGTLNVLVAARDAGDVRVVYASSAAVYGNARELPLHEGMPARPASPYGASKLAGERYLEAFTRTYGMPTVALRYLNVFGPRQDPRSEYAAAIPRFISRTLAGEAPVVFGDGEQARDFVFVDDVVRANLLAAEAGERVWGSAFNIGRGERRTVNELLEAIRSLVPGEHLEPVHEPPRLGEVRDSWSDIGAAGRELGYAPAIGSEEGLRRTIVWIERERAADLR
jgi:UDP-N-acetylglucosamine/UDP-N-acetyl-alpha-D-glucosaminouronate 4-epimerase